jgi:hypothetical protein
LQDAKVAAITTAANKVDFFILRFF